MLPLLVIVALAAYQYFHPEDIRVDSGDATGNGAVEAAFAARRSGVWLEMQGHVARVLSDDHEGSRHQRFVLQLGDRQTLLRAHNIDLAERVPVASGDRVAFRGMYEWNDLGGLVHWTHRDPHGIEDGGWVRFRTRDYA